MTPGDQYDAPNQQVVRGDGSGPADEGSGGSPPVEPEVEPTQAEPEPEPRTPAKPAAKAKGE